MNIIQLKKCCFCVTNVNQGTRIIAITGIVCNLILGLVAPILIQYLGLSSLSFERNAGRIVTAGEW